jgi:F0F1-type ATP synthase membrane subunit c/vacuolar-type H+-ATPase subunit K
MVAPQEWFITKCGLAVGLSMCGSGIGGLIFSNIAQASIQHLGINWALRIEGFVCMAFLIICTILVKSPENIAELPKFSFTELYQKQKKLVMQNRQF